jgi:hypothetical protein
MPWSLDIDISQRSGGQWRAVVSSQIVMQKYMLQESITYLDATIQLNMLPNREKLQQCVELNAQSTTQDRQTVSSKSKFKQPKIEKKKQIKCCLPVGSSRFDDESWIGQR